jgi:hypothetical protein
MEDKSEVRTFYQDLYTSQDFNDMDELLNFSPERVKPVMNGLLDKPFDSDEVRMALFQMAPSNAPGVDGSTAGFFQRHWNLVQHSVVPAILDFLNGGELQVGPSDTSITLIPKVRNPQMISQYRHISLCDVLYKIVAKAITNRLRGCLDEIISEEESAFVPMRFITDNVLVAYKSVHSMKRSKWERIFLRC